MTAVIVQATPQSKAGYQGFGAAATLWASRAPEVIIGGPYETGKTYATLQKLNALMAKYPGSRALMIRKTYTSLIHSAVVTFEKKVHNGRIGELGYPVTKYGGERPEWFDYPNGSRIVLGGLDKASKVLSAEYDVIYVNQTEELTEDEWQALSGRATGRAGNMPYTQLMGDCNPDVPEHWIQARQRVLLLNSRHEDNPVLFDQVTGAITEQGKRTMATLNAMTGVRYKRGRLGLWVGREGQVYEFDPAIHLINASDCPPFVRRYRVVDFGYTNPFVCQWWGEDNDGRIYRYRELYMSQRTVKEHAKVINQHREGYAATIADHDAEDRATLLENGIPTINADKRKTVGIEKVQERLKLAGDGRPRLYLVRDALIEVDQVLKDSNRPTSTEGEFPGYVWPERKAQRAADEEPVKADDHGMDAMRYMVMYLSVIPSAMPEQPARPSTWGLTKIEGGRNKSKWKV